MPLIVVNECDLTKGFAGRFEARLDGRLLCRSRQPLLDAARILLAEGCDPDERIVMRHAGSTVDALSAKVGVAAGLTVSESHGPPRFVRWQPFHRFQDAPAPGLVRPPIEFPALQAIQWLWAPESLSTGFLRAA